MPQTELKNQLDRIIDKSRLLLIRFGALKDELKKLKAENLQQEERIRALKAENESMRLELDYLRVASTISPREQDRAKTAELISGLVREIDQCISDLQH